MAEEKSDGEIPGSDPGKNASLDTTPVADVTQDRIEDEAPIPQAPNSPLLVLSWGVFTIGLYFLYAAGMGYYEDNVTEAKLALTVLLALLTIPIGIFLRKAAYHGFRKAFKEALSAGGESTAGGY
jgi:hypothetical protein